MELCYGTAVEIDELGGIVVDSALVEAVEGVLALSHNKRRHLGRPQELLLAQMVHNCLVVVMVRSWKVGLVEEAACVVWELQWGKTGTVEGMVWLVVLGPSSLVPFVAAGAVVVQDIDCSYPGAVQR